MALDFRTLLAVNFLINVINLGTMTWLWQRYGARYAGQGCWLAAMAAHVAGVGMILLRDMLPGVAVAVVANAILMSSTLFMLMGLQRFTATRSSQGHNMLVFALYVAGLYHYHAVEPSLPLRNVLSSALIVIVDLQSVRLVFWRIPPAMRRVLLPVGLVMVGYVLASLLRGALLLASPKDSAMFRSGLADSVTVASYLCLHICMMISLTLALTRRLMDDVRAQEDKFAKAFHLAPYALVISRRADGRIVEVNGGFSEIFGFSREEALGRTLGDLQLPLLREALAVGPQASPDPDRKARREIQVSRKSGELLVGQLASEELVLNGEPCLLSSVNDVTEESQLRQQLLDLATRDSLTGLANRRLFYERFELARLHAERHPSRMAVLSMDLDRFKAVNDELGHAAGDAVLVEAARRLGGCLRKVDLIARFGGDEFVLLIVDIAGAEDAARVAGKIVSLFRTPFAVQDREVALSASLGIALFPDNGHTLEALLQASDAALYRAKHAGRDGFCQAKAGSDPDQPSASNTKDTA